MDEDQILQSIIADPDVVDPSIDVSRLRKTTETDPRLLSGVSDIEGLRFDPTRTDYIRDLYSVYGGGLPTIDVAPKVVAPVVGTTTPVVDAGGEGGGIGPAIGGVDLISDTTPDTTPDTTIRDQLIDEGIQTAEDDKGDIMLDQGVLVGEAYAPIDTVDYSELDDLEADLGAQAIKDFAPEQQGLIDQAFSKVGSTASDIMNDLSQIPGAVTDFANQTVDIFGKKINVGKTLLSAGINKIVGGPISLVFDLLPESDPADTLNRNIVDELKAEKDYGFNMQSGNLNQDPFGRNPVSMFGDYEKTLADDAISTSTTTMGIAKKEFAQDYFDKKAGKVAPQEDIGSIPGDITTGADPVSGDLPGGGNIGDEFGSRGDTQATTGPTVSRSDTDYGQFGRAQSAQAGGGGNQGGGGKIVCTMMNDSYGFGSFRNKIWLKHSKDLAPEYQIGYHKIFLPLVKLSKTNKVLKKTLEHIAVHRTIDIRQEARGKMHLLGRVYRKILEPICYIVGKHAKR
jgi:hypothetical protein